MKTICFTAGIVLLALTSPAAWAGSLDFFSRTANAAISGYNNEHLTVATPEQCASACRADARSGWCVSFDYDRNNNACDLSDKRASDVGLKNNYSGNPYDHYNLRPDPLSGFQHVANAAIPGWNDESLTSVTPAQCAAACGSDERKGWCRSFDYYKLSSKCDLSGKRASDVGGLKTDYPGNPYDHYTLPVVAGTPNPIPGNRHVLFIGIDGLRGDALRCDGCAKPATLMELMDEGAFHTNVLAGGSQSTFSGPGWASAFTGFWANRHGVTSNDANLPLLETHVFDLIKLSYPGATTAVVGDWYNITHNLAPATADAVLANGPKYSQQATDQVKAWLAWTHAPTAIFYYLHNVDIHVCCYDPLSATYQRKILDEDAQIRQVLDALAARPNYLQENWLIVVASDHGGTASGHGGQSAAERDSLLILDNRYGKPNGTAYCRGDLSAATLTQIDGATPHILDFLGIPNPSEGRKHPFCGAPG